MDAVIPAGTSVTIEARSFDNLGDFEANDDSSWIAQPRPYLNGDGGELPKLSLGAAQKATARGEGCWDVLLQKLKGRYVQLRVTMAGDGRRSPSISAMRIWYPRFSYVERFLPALYSQEPVSGSFTERFLASVEGVNSVIEIKVAAAQYLLDPRFAPPEALDWLADWFDIALDPAWDEHRRRLFIKYAVRFFGWRGTLPGLRLALRLAFDPDITDCDFDLPGRAGDKANGIRIVENFRTRRSGRHLDGGRLDLTLRPLATISGAQWSPPEGKSGLVERWARHLGQSSATPEQQMAPFSLVADDYETEDWAGFMMQQFGFVPQLGGEAGKNWRAFQLSAGVEDPMSRQPVDGAMLNAGTWHEFAALISRNQQYWRQFLRGKYRQIGLLNRAWATKWSDFDQIALPDVLPETITAVEDWLMFEGQIIPMHSTAHRFSVLLPRRDTGFDQQREAQELALAKRIIALEKPAHTIFDVRFFWAMNRLGEARLGYDTQIGAGSRASQLIPPAILDRNVAGATFVGGPQNGQSGRERLAC
jgi:phage tail-like protein